MRAGGLGRSNASHNGTNSSRPDEQTHALLVGSQFSNGDGSENRRNGVEESSESETDDGNEVDVDNEDLEKITVVSLFDDAEFNTVPAMLAYVKELYNFDLVSVQKQLELDFLGMVKLVNFLRSEVKEGRGRPVNLSSTSAFDADLYLQPVLEDDALLYNLEDIIEGNLDQQQISSAAIPVASGFEEGTAAYFKISELQEALSRSQQESLAAQQRLELAEKALSTSRDVDVEKESIFCSKRASAQRSNYEGNYDGPELHRIMIADKARTESYRNFILQNPHLFQNKVVLDVGCGTSILSLFCAEAGAKVVYAVDQSESIINKAREVVFRNGKQDTIRLIHGRIQDISLPLKQVDIIVSEWMGYCLLYEAMFDSVIYARDRYLKNGGLMIPAQSTLYIAPFSHPEYRKSRIDFWDDVYGYDMGCFKPDVLKDVDVETSLSEAHLISSRYPFLTLDLYKAGISDLSLHDNPFFFTLTRDINHQIDGFAIWFDVTFSTPEHPSGYAVSKLTLGTGPEDWPTHWRQGLCLIDHKVKKGEIKLPQGLRIDGEISYEKEGERKEGLDITIKWRSEMGQEGKQVWLLH